MSDNRKQNHFSVPDEVDGLSNRQIMILNYKKTRSNGEQIDKTQDKVNKLDKRISYAEQVTDPINDIGMRAWDHIKKGMSYGVIATIGLLGFGIIWVFLKAQGLWNYVVKLISKAS